jgi:hypothetical protein
MKTNRTDKNHCNRKFTSDYSVNKQQLLQHSWLDKVINIQLMLVFVTGRCSRAVDDDEMYDRRCKTHTLIVKKMSLSWIFSNENFCPFRKFNKNISYRSFPTIDIAADAGASAIVVGSPRNGDRSND